MRCSLTKRSERSNVLSLGIHALHLKGVGEAMLQLLHTS